MNIVTTDMAEIRADVAEIRASSTNNRLLSTSNDLCQHKRVRESDDLLNADDIGFAYQR